jgi:hypothetical protein
MVATPRLLDLSSRRLPRSRRHWPADLCLSHRNLVRDLDSWCRDRLWPSRSNEAFAEDAIRRAEAGSPWRRLDPPVTAAPAFDDLPDDLRHWPASPRLRVSELERGGLARAAAVAHVRAEHRTARDDEARRCA